jgi:glycosyltransferase involved in cell wall biosynthesis
VPESKLEVIYNWCDESSIGASNEQSQAGAGYKMGQGFSVLFAGNMGRAQALDAVLQAAGIVAGSAPDVRFDFLGGGVEVARLKQLAIDTGLNNVAFHPAVPMAEVGKYLHDADALLVHLKQDPLFKVTIPSKTQAYMAAGRPIIMAVDGDAADLIRESQCGYIAQSENPEAIANAVLKMREMSLEDRESMAKKARDYYRDNLSIFSGVRRFANVFRSVS